MRKFIPSTLCLLSSFLILVYVILIGYKPIVYYSNELGFASQIPIAFWAGFIILLISFVFYWIYQWSEPSEKWCLLFLLLLISYWNVYVFALPTPIRSDSYLHFSEVFRLMEVRRTNVVGYGRVGWDGLFLFGEILFSITGFASLSFLRIYPIIISSVYVFAVFLLVKELFESRLLALTSTTLALFGNIALQFTFTPHSLAAALFPFLLLVFCKNKRADTSAFILMYLAVNVIYGFFPLFFATLLFTIGIFSLPIKKLFDKTNITILKVFLADIIVSAYIVFRAPIVLTSLINTLKTLFLRPPTVSIYLEAKSEIVFPFLALTRSAVFYTFVIIAIITTIYLTKTLINRTITKYSFLLFMNVLSLLLLLLSPYFSSLPQVRVWYLLVLGSSLSVPILILKIKRIKFAIKYCLPMFIIFISICGFIAFHAYDSYLVSPLSELNGANFISKYWNGNIVYDGHLIPVQLEFYSPQKSFEHRFFFHLNVSSLRTNELLVTKYTSYSYYFVRGKIDEYDYLIQDSSNVPYGNRIYDSLTLQAFVGVANHD